MTKSALMASQPPLRRPASHIVYLVLLALYLALDLWSMVSTAQSLAKYKDMLLPVEAPLLAALCFHAAVFIVLAPGSRQRWVYHCGGAALLLLSYSSLDYFVHFVHTVSGKVHGDPADVGFGALHATLLITQLIVFGYYSLGAASRAWYGLAPRTGSLWAWFWRDARLVDEPPSAVPAWRQPEGSVPDCHVALMVYLITTGIALGIGAVESWSSYFGVLSRAGADRASLDTVYHWNMAVACTMPLPLTLAVLAALACRLRRSWVYHTIATWIAYTVVTFLLLGVGFIPQLIKPGHWEEAPGSATATFLFASGFFLGLIGWRYIFGAPSRLYYGLADGRGYDSTAALTLPVWHKVLLGYFGASLLVTCGSGFLAQVMPNTYHGAVTEWWAPQALLPNLVFGFLVTSVTVGARQIWVYWVNTVILTLYIATLVFGICMMLTLGESLLFRHYVGTLLVIIFIAMAGLCIALTLPYILSASSRRHYGLRPIGRGSSGVAHRY